MHMLSIGAPAGLDAGRVPFTTSSSAARLAVPSPRHCRAASPAPAPFSNMLARVARRASVRAVKLPLWHGPPEEKGRRWRRPRCFCEWKLRARLS
jgi:hypothetical protein